MKNLLFALLLLLGATCAAAQGFIRTDGTRFVRDGQTYRFVGANFWYGSVLGSRGQGGDRERLARELDAMKALGIDNLRILAGADAGSKNVVSVRPYLQPEPGVLCDTLLEGLDYLLCEMRKRDMVAVIYLTNAWDWSGGLGFYLRAAGYGDSPDASGEGWNDYCAYAADFFRSEQAKNLYYDHVRRIVSRTNSLTGRPYADDPAIMAWQLCNEPRPFADDTKQAFSAWVDSTARLIKSLDRNHLVSTGSEGLYGCAVDERLTERIHALQSVDYLTCHIWPVNWGWSSAGNLSRALPNVFVKAGEYLALHERMARRLDKPLVAEEFGYPRDRNSFAVGTSTDSRDGFYTFMTQKLLASHADGGPLAGLNFWGWAGSGRPTAECWAEGADFLCDPPHEPQGWYSVYDTDASTLDILRRTAEALGRANINP